MNVQNKGIYDIESTRRVYIWYMLCSHGYQNKWSADGVLQWYRDMIMGLYVNIIGLDIYTSLMQNQVTSTDPVNLINLISMCVCVCIDRPSHREVGSRNLKYKICVPGDCPYAYISLILVFGQNRSSVIYSFKY